MMSQFEGVSSPAEVTRTRLCRVFFFFFSLLWQLGARMEGGLTGHNGLCKGIVDVPVNSTRNIASKIRIYTS